LMRCGGLEGKQESPFVYDRSVRPPLWFEWWRRGEKKEKRFSWKRRPKGGEKKGEGKMKGIWRLLAGVRPEGLMRPPVRL